MASEFDFLRVKWPKLAAMAADASRLADVSPSSALSSLRTYCEWATDIALDFYELQVAGGASQIEKLEALQTSGMVPAEILQKFHNVRSAGSRTSLRDLDSSSKLVHGCIADCLDIGQWLFREAEKEGWPHIDGYSQSYGAIPMAGVQGSSEVEGYEVGGDYQRRFSFSRFMRRYGSMVSLIIAVIVIGGVVIGISALLRGLKTEKEPPVTTIEYTATYTPEPTNIVPETPTPEPTPEEDPFEYIDDIGMTKASGGSGTVFFSHWNLNGNTDPFTMGGQTYYHGMAFFVKSDQIMETKGSNTVTFYLEGKFDKISFDLGCEQNFGYDVRANFGTYKITIMADDNEVWPGDRMDYDDVLTNVTVPLGDDCAVLTIKLDQYKGDKGTLNVVMGDFKLFYAETEEE